MEATTYLDESGTDDKSNVCAVAGYVFDEASIEPLRKQWETALDCYKLPSFHMVDCAHGKGPWKNMPSHLRHEAVVRFIELVKQSAEMGVATIVSKERFSEEVAGADLYSVLLQHVSVSACGWNGVRRGRGAHKGRMGFVFESGHKSQTKAGRFFESHANNLLIAPHYRTHEFAGKQEDVLLQCADILAWHATKFIKNRFFQKRADRSELRSLFDVPHVFTYLTTHPDCGIVIYRDPYPDVDNVIKNQWLSAMFRSGPEAEAQFKRMHAQYNQLDQT
ncbi:DUF3800 domain-containing protein [uncultured Tateyamaria sp.]|uniref:DUF3800 domain-containing protein n=1 Tax=uncultured Tateyamaria sp. TaxID=455651 RepID=UPI002624381B|nr:DUF3800 domain-containing protein [uncultured Tateyamaria sp.]